MEIIIGSTPSLTQNFPAKTEPPPPSGFIEAKLLHIRPPRKGVAGPSGMERRGKKTKDPLKGRVLTIMVPDGDLLPRDVDSGAYKVYLRFQK
jgi:hypothetical protein